MQWASGLLQPTLSDASPSVLDDFPEVALRVVVKFASRQTAGSFGRHPAPLRKVCSAAVLTR